GVTVKNYPLSRSSLNPLSDVKALFFLIREMRMHRPDVVFSYFSKPVIWGGLASKLSGVPKSYGMLEGLGYFFTDDGRPESIKKRVIRNIQVLLFSISLPLLDLLVILNRDDKKELVIKKKIKINRVYVLGGIGVDLKEFKFSPPPTDGPHFVFVGRLLAEKGINEFLLAADSIKSKYPDATFSIYGSVDKNNPGSVDVAYLEELSSRSIVYCPGAVSDINVRLADSSVFVLPSYREGFPRSTQEAMAVGRAVITTDAPGCRDTVIDGVNGFIVPVRDSLALTEAMLKFIHSPDLAGSMGRESRRLAEKMFDQIEVNKRLVCKIGL
ncbi:MAG: glycosyltransferase family 4 protein, partial [Flavobacteriaceae bacterium]|nr:glycosyltransferase family 4 protein [Flavobacteriaceae bacterium]